MKFLVFFVIALGVLGYACGDNSVFWANLKIQDCFNSSILPPLITDVEKVDCVEGNGDTQVIDKVSAGPKFETKYPGVERLVQFGLENCPVYSDNFYLPEQSEWDDGVRVILCVIFY